MFPRFTLGRSKRLRHQRDFQRVFATKRSAADDRLVVYVADNELSHSRLGISISRRVGNAVLRNRLKRCLREAFRTGQHELPSAMDIVCVIRPGGDGTRADFNLSLWKLVAKASRRRPRLYQSKPIRPRR